MDNLQGAVNLLFEVGILAKTPRSGFYFLGSGSQSVAEHTNRAVYCGLAMALMAGNVDVGKILEMCLLHDLAEGRTSDLNYVHQKYVECKDDQAIRDVVASVEFGPRILEILKEYKEQKTAEALIAMDADRIEWLLALKEQCDIGNERAVAWLPSAVKRVKTELGKKLAEKILVTNSDDWWFSDKENDWWVNRNKK